MRFTNGEIVNCTHFGYVIVGSLGVRGGIFKGRREGIGTAPSLLPLNGIFGHFCCHEQKCRPCGEHKTSGRRLSSFRWLVLPKTRILCYSRLFGKPKTTKTCANFRRFLNDTPVSLLTTTVHLTVNNSSSVAGATASPTGEATFPRFI